MSDDDLEQRIRTVLRADAENARISPHAWTRVSARLASSDTDARPRSHRGRSIGLAVAGVAALATVGALVGPQLLRSNEPESGRAPVIAASSPKATESAALGLASGRPLGSFFIRPEVDLRLHLSATKDGTATVQLAAYRITPKAIGLPPYAREEIATVAKPTDKVGVCEFRLVNGHTRTVTVSVAPAGEPCGKPVTYAISDTALTKTG
ncbi:hypothetical protein [Tenggerimyces flavus]|uniref:Uncharacterized protein n=1 Tax=Tenggerimyces flavus TaxID=1708749 RepID=A0ABV7Y8P7_9ACTN|nr:hypothetical protein [Tenggerimyces flavus]MBM7783465.1 hypothetical protein [Tenggerimyces flavus]